MEKLQGNNHKIICINSSNIKFILKNINKNYDLTKRLLTKHN
jgi:hypothetical protein